MQAGVYVLRAVVLHSGEDRAPKHYDHRLCGTLDDQPALCQIIIRHANGPFERVLSDTAKRYAWACMSDKTTLQMHSITWSMLN